MFRPLHLLALAAISAAPAYGALNLVDLNVDSVLQSVGKTSPVDNVAPTVGQTALYSMVGFDSAEDPLSLVLSIELIDATNLSGHRIEMGQGGTGLVGISIQNGGSPNQNISATYRFSFFESIATEGGITLGNSVSIDTIMQTADIDQMERVSILRSQFFQYGVSLNSQIVANSTASEFTFGADSENKDKTAPVAAVNLYAQNISSFEVRLEGLNLGPNQGREFQFDFNNPPSIPFEEEFVTPVPEPATYALFFGVMAAATLFVRRSRRSV